MRFSRARSRKVAPPSRILGKYLQSVARHLTPHLALLGLENKIEKAKIGGLNDDVRYSIKTKSFNKIEPKISREIKNIPGQEKIEEKIYDITKVKTKEMMVIDPITVTSVV